jgi:hypothetical protein
MKNKKITGFALALMVLSNVSFAGVGNFDIAKDFDAGTLGTTHYQNTFSVSNDRLLHGYIFDLPTASRVDARLLNLVAERGSAIPPIPIVPTYYNLIIFDSQDKELYKGTFLSTFTFGSSLVSHVGGELPAGEDYYVRVAGSIWNTSQPQLSYMYEMVASPVPEPYTYAMFVAGLGLLGWRIRSQH